MPDVIAEATWEIDDSGLSGVISVPLRDAGLQECVLKMTSIQAEALAQRIEYFLRDCQAERSMTIEEEVKEHTRRTEEAGNLMAAEIPW